MTQVGERLINEITVTNRVRSDLGDISELAASIKSVGLLHPVVVDENGRLIAGQRRLEACRLLGWECIPVNVVTPSDVLKAEHDENVIRKDFLPSEQVAIRDALFPIEQEAAKERQRKHGDTAPGCRNTGGKLPPVSKAKARDKVARYTGVSGRTLDKASQVVRAAEAEPEKYKPLVEEMDKTGRVHGVYRKLTVAKQAEHVRAEPPPMPTGPFRVVVLDPPWHYHNRAQDPTHRVAHPYASMSMDEIAALPVSDLAADDAVLWLWTTNAHIPEAFGLVDGWGFDYKTLLTWVKHKMGVGDWLRGQTEHCLMAVRGKPIVTLTNQTTHLSAKSNVHSAKPEEFFALVDALCPGSKLEMFCRGEPREGWQGWGLEAAA